ncbi:zinc ABC transporter substrate-binding protein [Fulvivirgaceae bacterium BMA10]|uniref:Zinc ABC transporter substrate-binding protein n=1 Tax=Splendidivirga corallicola TaxID=3051826 RepID=A0ABT8KV38_9BACT|nr:zinc ABC transporter substrate-binding protein [Fulvivirgaceae bacterium BMA10]
MESKLIKSLANCFSTFIILGTILLLNACSETNDQHKGQKLNIVATTGMIADIVKNVARDSVTIEALMGPGVDPHLYKATQGDLEKLTSADVIFYNGLYLEGKLAEILENLGRLKPVVAVSEKIDKTILLGSKQYENTPDPHIWFDALLWKEAVRHVSNSLQQLDSINASYYATNEAIYLAKLDSLHQTIRQQIETIPPDQRVMITAHDAFEYFGRAYEIEVRGLQGLSTQSEYGLKDVSDLVKFIIERKIKAVFVETSVSEKSIQAVVEGCRERGHDVVIGGSLFSDAMGEEGTPEGTYIGMVHANIKTIVEALK